MAELNFKQELVGCYGYPVSENPTQAMIEPAFRAMGLDWRYLTLEVRQESLKEAVEGARAFGFQGFNCTIPHKVEVIQYLDGVGESAELMGAVNCVVNRDGKLIGENTDGKGFVASLRELDDPEGKSVVIFGAGGAARAISVEMALAGATRITIVNRSEERGLGLVSLLQSKVQERCPSLQSEFVQWDGDYPVPPGTDIVINATSIGLYPDVGGRLALDTNSLSSEMIVADVIPNPPNTRLVQDATAKGCRVIDGLSMLVGQGVIGIDYWTGRTPDASVMRAGLEAVFGE
ncbi:MAG: shikimate dehydrogenase [Opitutales bacterium]|jgi:shikimate dehydrogenase|nr:shikimate dehydrogenase [Opitutales bacterium]MDG2254494.1 shikimate dehydrogenase [Opitutaceae bacterium]MBT5168932.1 shikimate dehydrogenase [Opitutales bacterium]MBT5812866.1 shikimate dehydrogenase [Opitutales bacterium]MBT6380415.1 shikimate dehydrogenase [Opitutales bacterium]